MQTFAEQQFLALCFEARKQPLRLAARLAELGGYEALVLDQSFAPSSRAWANARRQGRALQACGITLLPVWRWPAHLLRVKPLAAALFVRGDSGLLFEPGVAIVGSRKASRPARRFAHELAVAAVQTGYSVISGGALGIDAAAHAGALSASGKTVVFLGVAADCVYPRAHLRLFHRILDQGGALVSEYPPCSPTPSYCHAARNRFIAAMAKVLWLVEAGEKSGALSTVAFARRLGIPVYLPPATVQGEQAGLLPLLQKGWAQRSDALTLKP